VDVTRVLAGSPAERAGLRAGDVLVQLGETAVTQPVEVSDWVVSKSAGTEHPVSVLRAKEQRLFRVVLEGRPEFEDRLRLELVGRQAPEIVGVATFQGEASSLKELRGRVVVLEFWASFCGVCRYLAPQLDAWHRTYKPQGAEVIGITVDPPHLGQQVAQRTGMSYTLASDPDGKVTSTYLASQIPVVIIIDRSGVVRDAMVGYSERRIRETETLIERLVDQDSYIASHNL
jgi:peroxiredoxin